MPAKTTTAFARGADEGRVDRRVALQARELAWELSVSRTRCSVVHAAPREAGTVPDTVFVTAPALQRTARALRFRLGHKLERQDHVHELLAVARLLHVGDLAAAAISDAGLRDLAGVDGVVALDVFGPHDAGDDQLADFEIDANLLLAFDHQIAVGQDLRHHRSDAGLQVFLALH